MVNFLYCLFCRVIPLFLLGALLWSAHPLVLISYVVALVAACTSPLWRPQRD